MRDGGFRPVIDANALRLGMQALLEGDLGQLWLVREIDQGTLYEGTRADQPYLVTPAIVHRVLSHYRADPPGTAVDVQLWAQFVRNGFGPGPEGPIECIDIEYDIEAEDAIVNALGRMNELGDEIDGVITTAEADKLLSVLEQHLPGPD